MHFYSDNFKDRRHFIICGLKSASELHKRQKKKLCKYFGTWRNVVDFRSFKCLLKVIKNKEKKIHKQKENLNAEQKFSDGTKGKENNRK